MGVPTAEELETALQTAKDMRETGFDPHCVAKVLLNLHYRHGLLEQVLHAAESYLRGQGTREHSVLLRAIDKAREAESDERGARGRLGL